MTATAAADVTLKAKRVYSVSTNILAPRRFSRGASIAANSTGTPGGFEPDDHATFSTRARAVVDALLDAHGPDDRVGLVTHGNFTQFLLQELLGRPGGYFMTFNTATTCLTLMAGLQTTDAEVQNLTWLVRWVNRFDHLTPEQVSE